MNGNYFLLPNSIFDEGFTHMEFVVYSFLVSRKDKRNQSYYSIPHISENCGISETSCRKVLKEVMTNNIKPRQTKNEQENSNKQTNQMTHKTRFVGICRGHRNKYYVSV